MARVRRTLCVPFLLVPLLVGLLVVPTASAVQYEPLADLVGSPRRLAVASVGPEDPYPTAAGDGCLYALEDGSGAVRRTRNT